MDGTNNRQHTYGDGILRNSLLTALSRHLLSVLESDRRQRRGQGGTLGDQCLGGS
jgi:hypothetical protein